MITTPRSHCTVAWIVCGLFALSLSAGAQVISLGAANDFAVLGGSTITNTGTTLITGEVGVSPGTAVTGLSSGSVVGGSIHSNDSLAAQASADTSTAFTQLGLELATTNLTKQSFGSGLTLAPGTYRFDTTALLNGTLNLDFGTDPNAVFHFQIGTALTTASNSAVMLLNGNSNNVFWQVGSSATLGTGSQLSGTIIADQSITLNTGATLDGHALAIHGAVTLDSNTVSLPSGSSSVEVTAGGTLLLQTNNQLNSTAAVHLENGTLNLNGHTQGAAGVAGAGTLTLTATSKLDFGAAGLGNSLIQFAAIGGALDLNDHIVLQIINWQGTAGSGGGSERLLFGGSASEFTSRFSQNEVTFDGVAGYAAVQYGDYYEITAPSTFAEVPEPMTVFGGLVLLGMAGFRERRWAAAWLGMFCQAGHA